MELNLIFDILILTLQFFNILSIIIVVCKITLADYYFVEKLDSNRIVSDNNHFVYVHT